ncbi:MAG: 4,5-DOPA dioxygenase extradiol [Candidatus Altimarinota bacterium]
MKQPLIFIGHGNPMNAIEKNSYSDSWRDIGNSVKVVPRAILMLSAHWITEGETRINTADHPAMIYDMYGFPPELYRVKYECPGSKEIVNEIVDSISSEYSLVKDEEHGLDHGAWSTLIHVFPDANIPVIQMSLDYSQSPEWHYEFGKKLQILREQGILIIGSGNIVHNLRAIDWSNQKQHDWAIEFDRRVKTAIEGRDHQDILHFKKWGQSSLLAHPTIDHFLPLFPLLGAIREDDAPIFSTEEITMGSLSMRSILWS